MSDEYWYQQRYAAMAYQLGIRPPQEEDGNPRPVPPRPPVQPPVPLPPLPPRAREIFPRMTVQEFLEQT